MAPDRRRLSGLAGGFQGIGNRLGFSFKYLTTKAVSLVQCLLICLRFMSYSLLRISAWLCLIGAFMANLPIVTPVGILYVSDRVMAFIENRCITRASQGMANIT